MKLDSKEIQRLRGKYGQWVLVTGATSGIGKEMAIKFAEAGFHLLIGGWRGLLLAKLASQWRESYGVEVISVVGDLTREEDLQALMDRSADIPVGIAVLNAGSGTSGPFLEAELDRELGMLAVNCRAVMVLSHFFARRMAERGSGALVMMSSIVAFQGVPHAAHYAATKAYVQSFGEALSQELKGKGVDVLCAAPGPVDSGFAAEADMKMGNALKPEEIAVPIIRAVGRRSQVLPGFLTKFLVYNLRMVPRWAKIRIMGQVMKGFTKHQAPGPKKVA